MVFQNLGKFFYNLKKTFSKLGKTFHHPGKYSRTVLPAAVKVLQARHHANHALIQDSQQGTKVIKQDSHRGQKWPNAGKWMAQGKGRQEFNAKTQRFQGAGKTKNFLRLAPLC
jgi:hypothetical protein